MATSSPPLYAEVLAFNRKDRCIMYTIQVHFEGQSWHLERRYSDFLRLHRDLETSQYNDATIPLPPKHPIGLIISMKFSGQHSAKKKETPFLKDRLTALQEWTSTLLQNVGPTGVDEVDCLDTFFQAFSPGNNPSAGNCDMRRSMFHLLKSVRISTNVYNQLWNDGYTYSTLHTIPREKWESMGVAMGSIEQLETKLHGLRHDNFQTMIGPNGQVTSIATDAVTGSMKRVNSIGSRGIVDARMGSTGSFAGYAASMPQQQPGQVPYSQYNKQPPLSMAGAPPMYAMAGN